MAAFPLVSFVVSADDGARHRLPALLQLLAWQCHALDLPAELLLVESADAPPITLPSPGDQGGGALAVRILKVRLPPALRGDPSPAAGLRLRQNAGIRTAAGRFVASLGADRLPSPQLLRWIALGGLEPGALYWANSWFCDASVDDDAIPPSQRVGALIGGLHHIQTPFGLHPVRFAPNAPPHQLVWELAEWTRRFISQRLATLAKQGNVPPLLPCNSFVLMSRADWRALRGFPEWPLLQGHFGTILAVLALAAGRELRFTGMERPVLALTEGPTTPPTDIGLVISETEDEGERLLNVKLSTRTHLTDDHAYALALQLLDLEALRWLDGFAAITNPAPAAVVANGPDWGTAAEILDEIFL